MRSYWKLPHCPTEPVSDDSEDGHDAGTIREVVNASVVTHLRRKSAQEQLFLRGGQAPLPGLSQSFMHSHVAAAAATTISGQPVVNSACLAVPSQLCCRQKGRGSDISFSHLVPCMKRGIEWCKHHGSCIVVAGPRGQQEKHGEQFPHTEPRQNQLLSAARSCRYLLKGKICWEWYLRASDYFPSQRKRK